MNSFFMFAESFFQALVAYVKKRDPRIQEYNV